MQIKRRRETPDDEAFVRRLVVDTIGRELGADAWPEPMRAHLLGTQFEGRRQSHRTNYPDAVSEVIEADGEDAGVDRGDYYAA